MIKWNQKEICVSVCMNSCKKKKKELADGVAVLLLHHCF